MNQKLNILVVDDDKRMTSTLSDILQLAGHEVVEAASAMMALEKVKTQSFDCVLTDIRMPEMDGVEFHRQLREIQPGLPVVLMTAYASDTLTRQGLDNGVIGVLDKPLDINNLLSFLTSMGRNRTIVLVDDDPEFCKTLSGILSNHGFKVAEFTDPHVNMDLITSEAQVILLDYKFNGINGIDVLRDIRKNNPNLPVLFVTGYRKEMESALQSASEIEDYTCLYKPLKIPQLLQTLSEYQMNHLRGLLKKQHP